ncbi:hypothetical protein [Streptomyces violascens]|uniref:hypothetical protein n=1 Tax=Streptomyces violascens TaxID=67381 RepID=UPI00167AA976|nr:hypothetical protein [Streptomyces violascens]
MDLATAQLRADTARAEAADGYARLTPRQRSARRVARMLLASQPDTPADKIEQEAVPLTTVRERLDVSQSTASEIRKEAMALLLSEYSHQEAAADASYEPEPKCPTPTPAGGQRLPTRGRHRLRVRARAFRLDQPAVGPGASLTGARGRIEPLLRMRARR